jgi:L-rhamnose isomerase/sugar isomerase
MIAEWRRGKGLPEDPMKAFRESGYLERITRERRDRNMGAKSTYA